MNDDYTVTFTKNNVTIKLNFYGRANKAAIEDLVRTLRDGDYFVYVTKTEKIEVKI